METKKPNSRLTKTRPSPRTHQKTDTGFSKAPKTKPQSGLANDEIYRQMFELSPDAIVIHNGKKILLANRACARLLGGVEPEELIGKPIKKFIHREQIALVEERFEQQRQGISVPPLEERLVRLDGNDVDVELVATPFHYNGAPASLVLARDISARKRTEEVLRRSEIRFRALIENSWDALILVDSENRILYYAPANERIFGYSAEERIGQYAHTMLHPDDREAAALRRSQAASQPEAAVTAEYRVQHKNGSWVWVEAIGRNLLAEPSVQAYVVNLRDISERKQAEARILRLNRLYATLSQINKVIVRTRERGALLHEICRVVTQEGKFRMAWIGWIDPEKQVIRPLFFAGEEQGYLDGLKIKYRNQREARGPTGTAIREERCIICQDIASDPRMAPWRKQALQRNYRSSAAVPIREHGIVVGALTVYATEPYGFDLDDERLLDEIGEDISFALDTIDSDTERQRAEEALRTSEARFRALVENSWEGLTLVSQQNEVVYASPANEYITGYTRTEREGKNAVELIHPEDAARVVDHLRRVAMQDGCIEEIEYRARAKDGSWKWIESIAHNRLEEPGVQAIVVNFRDITERKQADEQINLQKALLESASEASLDGIAIISKEREWLHHNQRYVEMWNIPPNLVAKGDSRRVAKLTSRLVEDPESYLANLDYLYENMDVSQQDEVHFKDGRIFDRYTGPVWAANGAIYGRIWYCRDITERKQAEEALKASESRWQAIFDHAGIGIALVDNAGRPVQNNFALQKMLGYTREELSQMPFAEFTHPADVNKDLALYVELAQGKREKYQIEKRYIRKDGEMIWVNLTATALQNERGDFLVGVGMAEDITERKRAELQAIRNQNRLNQAIQLAGLGIWDWDLISDRIEWSGDMFRIYGINPETFTGKGEDYIQFTRADYRETQRKNIDTAFKQGVTETELVQGKGPTPDPKELCIVRPDGTECYTLGDAICILDENGKAVRMLGITQDITARKQSEQTQARLTAIIEATPDFVGIASMDLYSIYINRAGRRMVGISEQEDISGLPVHNLSPAWANDIIAKEGIPTAIREGVWTGETARLTRDGREIPVTQVIIAHKGLDGQVEYLSTISRDISERKRAEEKLQRQLERMTALSEIDRAITSSFDVRQSLEIVLGHVSRQLNIDAADVLLYDQDAQILEYVTTHGFRTRIDSNILLHIGQGYAGHVIRERQMLNVPNLGEYPPDPLRSQLFAEEAFVTYYAVPLIAKGQIRGVLELFQRSPLTPEKEWVDFLRALAEQAAIAIDNATLFNNLQRSNTELSLAYDATIEGWSRALDLRDRETEGHTQRVTDLTVRLARAFKFSEAELVQIRWGALLHDIGKMGVPDGILFKPGPLIAEEWAIMKKHPVFAFEMLSPIRYLRGALDIPHLHHEKWDGTGYPLGLKGEQIPLTARIFAVVDVWDALRSDRPYRPAWSAEKARDYIRSLVGTHFDPQVVQVFLESDILKNDEQR